MAGLSYSAHLSQKNSAINSKAKLSGVAKHNLRKYRSNDYDKENIVILWGTDKLVQDIKKVYREQFSEAVEEYNKKQTREERKIHDYFEKTAKSNKDMAVEMIFQIGDKEFWDKNPDKRRRMDVAFKEILELLQKFAPNLVVANAVIHYDEASPHMHVVAVPVADGFKKGMSKQGMDFGVYLSPWDMHDERYGTDAYNDYFCNQLTELLTNYGEIFEVWFDGAKGSNAKKFEYDWQRYYDLIRKLQPKANIAICGPDIRWVGNEGGKSRKSEYSVVPCALREADRIMALSQQDESQASSLQKYNQMDEDLGSRKILEKNAYICWFPAEVDVSIRKGWFFHEKDNRNSKSAKKLFKIYLNSVGNNCTLLLNIPPTPQGEIHKKDAKNLKKLGSMIKNITANPIVYNELGELTKDNGVLDFDFNDTRKVKYVVLEEDITKSQRVELFDLYIKKANGKYKRVYKGTVIGSKGQKGKGYPLRYSPKPLKPGY